MISQGGEFAFVLFAAGALQGVIDQPLASLLVLAVTLSMAATPLLLRIDDALNRVGQPPAPEYEIPPEGEEHVIIAGFGRFGQHVSGGLPGTGLHYSQKVGAGSSGLAWGTLVKTAAVICAGLLLAFLFLAS